MSNKQIELRSEYESTYLAYASDYNHISFEDWLVAYKGYKPKLKTKEQLINRVLDELNEQVCNGDFTVLEELLSFIPNDKLIGSLDEDEWKIYSRIKVVKIKADNSQRFMCTNCGGGFKRSEMVFDKNNDNDFCKGCI